MEIDEFYVKSIIDKEPALRQFLKSNSIYEKFIYNCINHYNDYMNIYTYDPGKNRGDVFHSFQWSRTDEGMHFWYLIIRKYKDLLFEF